MVFTKLENALHRANELIDVGKKLQALNTLFEVITSRRHRIWTINHEPLINKFLQLCIDLKKSQLAKDGLYQYKTISQEISVESLDVVIMNFLAQAEEECSKARQKASNAITDIDDLEVLQTPENLLLSAVSGASQQDRTDRDVLAPWLKFVWESYKQCLDLLKNNNLVERTYHKIARKSFSFCKTYNRRTEFRKLCETLRTHFQQSQKYSKQKYSINIYNPETQELHLATRLFQLDTAIDMELWQEAIKAVEDIHTLTKISKKPPGPRQLASYYQKLALVFWKSGNPTFHATTLLSLYVLHKEHKKNVTLHELNVLATKALLSILSITSTTPRTQIDDYLENEETILEKQRRLTNLLSLQQLPTRASLVRDMIKHGVLNFVNPELKTMYECLEIEFNPLKLSKTMEESIQFIGTLNQSEYSQYLSPLRDVTVVRLLQQISQVYQTIEINRFIQLAPSVDKHRLEKLIVNSAKNNDVQVRIEHKSNALTFGTDLNFYNSQKTHKTNVIQKMPNEQVRNQLISISNVLHLSMEIINEKQNKERNDKLIRQIAETYHREELAQRKETLKRSAIIERYKEDRENESKDRKKQLETVSRQIQDEREKEDKARTEAERKRKLEEIAIEREREEHRLKLKVAIDKLCKSELGRKIVDTIGHDDIYSYDPDSLNNLHIDALKKDAQEKREKLRSQFKKVDYFVRAQHEAEIPLIENKSEAHLAQARHIQEEARRLEMERRENLFRMNDEKDKFLELIRGERKNDFNKQMEKFNQRLKIAREKRLKQLRKENFEKQKQLRQQQREEENKKKIEDEFKREREERLAEFKREREEREANRKRELDEQARKQRERDRAIEEKLEKQKLQTETSQPSPSRDRRSTNFPQRSDQTERIRRPNPNSRADANDNWRNRSDNQRRRGNDQRFDDSWKQKPKYEDDQRRFPSQQQQQQHSSSDRRTEQTSDGPDSWIMVERKRTRPETERSTQQQQQSKEPWRPRTRRLEETRENVRTGSNSSMNSNRAENNTDWRSREKKRHDSWRSNENENENEQFSSENRRRNDKQ